MNKKMIADVDRWLAENDYAAETTKGYRRVLRLLVAEIDDLAGLDGLGLRAWLDRRGWGSSMRWMAFCAIRVFLRWRFGSTHPALALKIKRLPSPPQRSFRLPEVKILLASFDTSSAKGRRDLAICGLALDTGLRVSELCRLSTRYLDLGRQCLQVIVKGGQWSYRAMSEHTAMWISAWLVDRAGLAAPGVDEVFVSVGGITPGKGLTRGGLQVEVEKWGKRAGIGQLYPHDLRRSMASVATVLGAPEDIAMKAGGWKNHEVFRHYTVGVTPDDMRPYFPTTAAMQD